MESSALSAFAVRASHRYKTSRLRTALLKSSVFVATDLQHVSMNRYDLWAHSQT